MGKNDLQNKVKEMSQEILSDTPTFQTTLWEEPKKVPVQKKKKSDVIPDEIMDKAIYTAIGVIDEVIRPLKLKAVSEGKNFRILISEILYDYCKQEKIL